MNSTTPITIAIPGEKRNGKVVKQFLLKNRIIKENDMNQEVINSIALWARLIQIRAIDALSGIQTCSWKERTIDLVISGMDQMREEVSWREIFEAGSLTWFSYMWVNGDWNPIDKSAEEYSIPFVLDGEKSTSIQLLVREEDSEEYTNIQFLRNLSWSIISPYPVLARKIIDSYLPTIKKVSWKTEALVRAGFGTVWIDVVDTWETARKNGLVPTKILFESYPAGIVSASKLEQDKRLQDIVRILTDVSNNTYYSSSRYRIWYPRG